MSAVSPVSRIVRKRTQLLAKLRNEARRQSVTVENIQHQFAFDMFLTRLFAHDDCCLLYTSDAADDTASV